MFFTYKYIKHDVEKLQEYLDFLFYDVWITAEGSFNFSKLANPKNNDELKKLCEQLEIEDTKWGNFFNSRIAIIYDEFAKINDDDFKLELIDLYSNNNNVEDLCKQKLNNPISYSELEIRYPELNKALNSFYTKLYGSESPFNLAVFGQLNKKLILSHYEEFVILNNEGLCPFCGIFKIDGNIVETREAYDHYLPKSVYPFNSVNFKNLAPMCDKCNSRNKGVKDPIDHSESRRLAFYPYCDNHPKISVSLTLNTKDVKNIKAEEIDIDVNAINYDEQVETWKRVFGIIDRFKELCVDKNEGITWYSTVIDGFESAKALLGDIEFEKWVELKITEAGANKLSSYSFLKEQFLIECRNKNLFNIK